MPATPVQPAHTHAETVLLHSHSAHTIGSQVPPVELPELPLVEAEPLLLLDPQSSSTVTQELPEQSVLWLESVQCVGPLLLLVLLLALELPLLPLQRQFEPG
ncbi:MAG: hypothetical protein EBV03_12395 [Proteobacteria bacterium]|nr:hypothetical protein [Pseudomonadota bacterium]